MKIDVYLNNFFIKYNHSQINPTKLEDLKVGFLKGIYNEDDLFILRGEPGYRNDLDKVLSVFKRNNNFILTTNGFNPQPIWDNRKKIPYLSLQWDGFRNDLIKGNNNLTLNIMRTLELFKNVKNSTVRIAYTISPFNFKWFVTDIYILRNLMDEYPNMKQPYFMLYQQGDYYSQDKMVWPSFSKDHLDMLNRGGLLTKKNFNYLNSWIKRVKYQCTSPMNEISLMPDATFRLCQSYKLKTKLGSLREHNFQQVLEKSKKEREDACKCAFKERCWLAYHYKDNVNE